ncbi:MAG: hypothetical protein IPJ61_16225 [Tessaracoccus sp.]|uniref:Rv3654c family TadE-like protein n=1 Tax=Tessaracoccus sp. TaxID=1971211 RepID=UPI001ED17404|nr:Rv3654c family TadE-like protein [Tessaracoccus sp.]MBK7822557.1 hypothetical protein [Tessaracoccus sp.]
MRRPTARRGAARCRDERGVAGGLLTLGMCLAVLVVSLTASTVVVWVGQARHAQQAADLAALAGATAAVEGGSACDAAAHAAERNDAWVANCAVKWAGRSVVVEIAVVEHLIPVPPWGPATVTRRATAGT